MSDERKYVDEVLNNYSIGTCQQLADLSSGYANINYKVTTEKGDYLLRVFSEKNATEIGQEMSLLETLQQSGFPIACPIKRLDGQYVSRAGEAMVVIYEFIEGEEPKLNSETVGEIARMTARLSKIELAPSFERPNGINMITCLRVLDEIGEIKVDFPDLYVYFSETTHRLSPLTNQDLPQGIIHGDLFPDNTVFRDNKLLAVLDFEDYAVDSLLFDVGMTINGFCYCDNRLNVDFLKIFLREYENIRSLTRKERELLPHYIQWAAHGMLSWHLQHFERTNAKQVTRLYEWMQRGKDFWDTLCDEGPFPIQ